MTDREQGVSRSRRRGVVAAMLLTLLFLKAIAYGAGAPNPLQVGGLPVT